MLGRETAIQQVEWTDDGWLALTTGGTVAQLRTPAPGATEDDAPEHLSYESFRDDFDGPTIDRRFSTLRRPFSEDWLTLRRQARFAEPARR